jgi:chromosome segregation ATPase
VPKEADSQKAGIEPTKTVGKKPIQKIKPETQIAKKEPSKKITSQKSVPIPDSKTKKTTPPKIETVAQKTAPDTKMATKEPQKNINQNSRPVTHETVTKQKTHTEISKEITRITKKTTEIETKTVPQVRKMKTDKPVSSQAEKDLDSLITANKKDLKKLTETKKIETDNSKVTQKDESIVLAKLESTRKVLANKKKALNEKFMALMKEKQEIENSVNEDDEKSVLEYNENVKNLNIRIKQYKKEKKFLQAEIEKYNDTIKQSALN